MDVYIFICVFIVKHNALTYAYSYVYTKLLSLNEKINDFPNNADTYVDLKIYKNACMYVYH